MRILCLLAVSLMVYSCKSRSYNSDESNTNETVMIAWDDNIDPLREQFGANFSEVPPEEVRRLNLPPFSPGDLIQYTTANAEGGGTYLEILPRSAENLQNPSRDGVVFRELVVTYRGNPKQGSPEYVHRFKTGCQQLPNQDIRCSWRKLLQTSGNLEIHVSGGVRTFHTKLRINENSFDYFSYAIKGRITLSGHPDRPVAIFVQRIGDN